LEDNRDYKIKIKSEIEFEISKTQNMTLRGDVPVTYLLQKYTMRKSSNTPVERLHIHTCAGTRPSNSRFVFKNNMNSRLDNLNGS
jgi:hypothetical protein